MLPPTPTSGSFLVQYGAGGQARALCVLMIFCWFFVIISPQGYVYLVYKYVEQSSSSSFCRNLLEKEDYVDQIEVNGH